MSDVLLNAEASPEAIKPGVRRLNWIPLYIIGAILFLAALIVFWVALEKGKVAAEAPADHGSKATDFAAQVVGNRTGWVSAMVLATPTPAPAPAPAPSVPPQPVATPAPVETGEDDARHKAFFEALFAKSAVADPNIVQDQQQATQQETPAPKALPPGNNEPPEGIPKDPNALSSYNGTKDRWTLNTHLEPPLTPYIIRTGFVIPALLMSAMESELPGTIIAQVSQDVYDTATGRYLLIPQGSRLLGQYSNAIQYGQSRVFVAWERIIYPDSSALDIGAMPGVDEQGEAGFHDQVNNHFLRIFGSALLMSAITGGIALSQQHYAPQAGYQAANSTDVLSQALGQQLGAATSALLERNLSIPPTLKIRPGLRFNIIVVKDLVFEHPYPVANY
jgi:type IV secretion system protein VirB10